MRARGLTGGMGRIFATTDHPDRAVRRGQTEIVGCTGCMRSYERRRIRLRVRSPWLVALMVLGLVCGGPVAAAVAVPAWTVVPSTERDGSTQSQLLAVACPSATFCIAVGNYVHGRTEGLIERWNGANWAVMHARNPRGFWYSTLSGIACPTTTSCFAVGTWTSYRSGNTLIEHWDGTAWSIMPSPTPAGGYNLQDVACPSATSCFAVAGYSGGYEGGKTIEHWNGTRWTVMTDTSVGASARAALYGVACPSANNCFAVGDSNRADLARCPLVEHWTGHGSWKLMDGTPCRGDQPYGPWVGADLAGVACPTNTSCFSVGWGNDPVFLRWNGRGAWTLQDSPVAGGPGGDTWPAHVTCTSTTSCVAVGQLYIKNDKAWRALIEQWNGTTWTLATPPVSPVYAELFGIACTSDTACEAVGNRPRVSADPAGRTHTLVERYG